MGKTYRFDPEDDSDLLTERLDLASAELMKAELVLRAGDANKRTKLDAITDDLGDALDDIESQPGNYQAEADAERQAIWNAAQRLGALVEEKDADDGS